MLLNFLGYDVDFFGANWEIFGERGGEMYEPNITLEIAVPCPNQELKWSKDDKERYKKIMKNADKITLISETYTYNCMQKRNEYMVDHSDLVLAFWNGIEKGGTWNTIKYSNKHKIKIAVIYLHQ